MISICFLPVDSHYGDKEDWGVHIYRSHSQDHLAPRVPHYELLRHRQRLKINFNSYTRGRDVFLSHSVVLTKTGFFAYDIALSRNYKIEVIYYFNSGAYFEEYT